MEGYSKSRFVLRREASEPNRDLNGSGDTHRPTRSGEKDVSEVLPSATYLQVACQCAEAAGEVRL